MKKKIEDVVVVTLIVAPIAAIAAIGVYGVAAFIVAGAAMG